MDFIRAYVTGGASPGKANPCGAEGNGRQLWNVEKPSKPVDAHAHPQIAHRSAPPPVRIPHACRPCESCRRARCISVAPAPIRPRVALRARTCHRQAYFSLSLDRFAAGKRPSATIEWRQPCSLLWRPATRRPRDIAAPLARISSGISSELRSQRAISAARCTFSSLHPHRTPRPEPDKPLP